LLYSSENWAINARKITAADMRYTIKTAGYTWTDYRTNIEIAKELNITQFWTKHRTTDETGYNVKTECLVTEYGG